MPTPPPPANEPPADIDGAPAEEVRKLPPYYLLWAMPGATAFHIPDDRT
ncbi:hypothetical protein [Planobispora rosea]|nr:hypothetical protein [Planobispora rosea]